MWNGCKRVRMRSICQCLNLKRKSEKGKQQNWIARSWKYIRWLRNISSLVCIGGLVMDIRLDYSGNELGKYYLIQKLGNGGFGAVYKAHDRILGVEKAIKILEVTDPQEAFKLFSEAAIPYNCRHDHIIKINVGEIIAFNDELVFVVDMELANGESIDSLLKNTYISVIDCLNIMRDILFAVEYSHLQGVIHRDIKPANILMDNGIPKLSDFGLSTALGNELFLGDGIGRMQLQRHL